MRRSMASAFLSLLLTAAPVYAQRPLPESELKWLRANSYRYQEPPPPANGPYIFVVGDTVWPYAYPMPRWYRFQYYGPFLHGAIPLGLVGTVGRARSTVTSRPRVQPVR